MSTDVEPRAYTVRECAEALRVSERTVRRAVSAGKIQSIRVGRLVRVPAESLRQFVNGAGVCANTKTERKGNDNASESPHHLSQQ
jgi:excisionase family DNA binding protein